MLASKPYAHAQCGKVVLVGRPCPPVEVGDGYGVQPDNLCFSFFASLTQGYRFLKSQPKIDLIHNGGPIRYSFVLMLISLLASLRRAKSKTRAVKSN